MGTGLRFAAWTTSVVLIMVAGIADEACAQAAPAQGVVPLHEMHGQMKETVWGDPDRETVRSSKLRFDSSGGADALRGAWR